MRFFWFKVAWPDEPIWAPDEHPKNIFKFGSPLPRNFTLGESSIFSVYEQILSAYSWNTKRFILHIQRICTAKSSLKI
jgi:hypothetical protein